MLKIGKLYRFIYKTESTCAFLKYQQEGNLIRAQFVEENDIFLILKKTKFEESNAYLILVTDGQQWHIKEEQINVNFIEMREI